MDQTFAAGPPRRRSGLATVAMVALALANALVWGGAVILFRPGSSVITPWPIGPVPSIVPVAPSPLAPETPAGQPLPVFATARGIRLRAVSGLAVAVAFHEASYDDALALRPTGVCGRCKNPTKFTAPPPRDPSVHYLVTHSRGRDTPATSAADLVVPKATPILSPVDGLVVRVHRYRLYRSYPDMRVEIAPDSEPGLLVVLLHLGAVQVRKGERVTASETLIGVPRRLPFQSQVDRYVRGRYPHVHLEVKDAATARQTSV